MRLIIIVEGVVIVVLAVVLAMGYGRVRTLSASLSLAVARAESGERTIHQLEAAARPKDPEPVISTLTGIMLRPGPQTVRADAATADGLKSILSSNGMSCGSAVEAWTITSKPPFRQVDAIRDQIIRDAKASGGSLR